MNFLAHAHLSGNNDDVLFGNFVADSVKGRQIDSFHPDMIKGIRLHRMIDQFTDQHPVVKNSVQLIKGDMGRFSGVVIDIFYDHFLARNWNRYDERDLTDFSMHVYKILARRFFQLPARNKRILPFMMAQNWLVSYANTYDLKRVFYGMNRRTGFKSEMENAVEVLHRYNEELAHDFETFYPDLQQFVASKLKVISVD